MRGPHLPNGRIQHAYLPRVAAGRDDIRTADERDAGRNGGVVPHTLHLPEAGVDELALRSYPASSAVGSVGVATGEPVGAVERGVQGMARLTRGESRGRVEWCEGHENTIQPIRFHHSVMPPYKDQKTT